VKDEYRKPTLKEKGKEERERERERERVGYDGLTAAERRQLVQAIGAGNCSQQLHS